MGFFVNASKEFIYFSIILGFIAPFFGEVFRPYLMHILFIMMSVSLISINLHGLREVRPREITYLILINLLVYSSLQVILSYIFIPDIAIRQGMIILALVPPAISVIPLTVINMGDTKVSIMTEFIAYLICVIYTPIMLWVFFRGIVDIFSIMQVLAALIILPFVVSRLIRRFWKKSNEFNFSPLISLLIGISVYTSISLSRDIIISEWHTMIAVFCILFLLYPVLGTIIFAVTKKLGVERQERIEYVLFGTLKNGNMALGFSLLLIGPVAAVPISVGSIVYGLYVSYLAYLFGRQKKKGSLLEVILLKIKGD